MKKRVFLLLVLSVLCALCACREETKDPGVPPSPPVTAEDLPASSPGEMPSEAPVSGTDIGTIYEYPASDSDILPAQG